ncbi:ligand-gated ion channel [Salininema proteolyticum]|uniref:Neurotransmitter-gated ion-channel ligand binding domain-containing protein n=1 Tax=Salininema proteolyticum TaxID=1607685 RepID=A0ABV8U077_9ACTN
MSEREERLLLPEGRARVKRGNAVAATVLVFATGFLAVIMVDDVGEPHRADDGITAVWLVTLSSMAVYCLLNLLIKPWNGPETRAWTSVAAFSALAVLAMVSIWGIALNRGSASGDFGVPVEAPTGIDALVERETGRTDGYVKVPTGIYVRTLDYDSRYNVTVSGTVWQHYPADFPADAKKQFAFRSDAISSVLEEDHREDTSDGGETITWSFELNLRERTDFRHFPLDRQTIWIPLQHAEHRDDILLVPDFYSYPVWERENGLGLAKYIELDEWTVSETVFSYHDRNWFTTFGNGLYNRPGEWPQLHYNIVVARDLSNQFGSTLVPLAAVSVFMFATMMVTTKQDDRRAALGFSTLSTIAVSMTALIVIVVRHNDIISASPGPGVTYLEVFPFVIYTMTMAAALNAVLYARLHLSVLEWRDNLLPSLLYWPVLTGALLAATAIYFG